MAGKVDELTALGLSLRFDVVLEGVDLGTWAKVEGLDIKFDLCEYREGGKDNNFRYYAPGLAQYTNVKMTRSLTALSAAMVGNWIRKTAHEHTKGTGVITMYDAWTKPVFAWELIGVMPVHWSGPQFDATGGKVATETLEIAHQGWLEAPGWNQ